MPSIRETVIASEVSCPSCSVVVDTVVTLENVELSPRPGAIAWDPAGVFYLVDRSDGLLKAFGADGRRPSAGEPVRHWGPARSHDHWGLTQYAS